MGIGHTKILWTDEMSSFFLSVRERGISLPGSQFKLDLCSFDITKKAGRRNLAGTVRLQYSSVRISVSASEYTLT